MHNEVVITVATETDAQGAVDALEALDDVGSIELFASAIVTKAADGKVTVKQTKHMGAPWGAAVGASAGAALGMLGGPAGAAAGAAVGGAVGAGGDVVYSAFTRAFVRRVSASLEPGSSAACAIVGEDWPEPLDGAVARFHGEVVRHPVGEAVAAHLRAVRSTKRSRTSVRS